MTASLASIMASRLLTASERSILATICPCPPALRNNFRRRRAFELLGEGISEQSRALVLRQPQLAQAKAAEATADGWHFLTGSQASIDALTKAAGFNYAWDEQSQQFAHASGIIVATPEGRLSRYFFGIDYSPRDVKFALIEASANKIGSLADQLLLYCYHYDPAAGNYGFAAMRAVRIGGAVTLAALMSVTTSGVM